MKNDDYTVFATLSGWEGWRVRSCNTTLVLAFIIAKPLRIKYAGVL